MNNLRLSQIMRYIKQYPFEYEIEEVEENLNNILCDYGIYDVLSDEEVSILKQELLKLAKQFEVKESVRLAMEEDLLLV